MKAKRVHTHTIKQSMKCALTPTHTYTQLVVSSFEYICQSTLSEPVSVYFILFNSTWPLRMKLKVKAQVDQFK